ncbi:MAG: hypothetical protein U0R64_04595 [Candidatus Nanopelagicales bacterium]
MGLGACAAVALALSGLRVGSLVARTGLVLAIVAPLMVGGWWLAAGDSLIRRGDPVIVSPFVQVASLGPAAPRSLELHQRPDGAVTYQILGGLGPRLGDAEVAPAAADLGDFGAAVSRAAAGSPQGVAELAAASVRFLTVDVSLDRSLARQLDAVPGIRRVSTLEGRGLWELSSPLPRVRAVGPDGATVVPTDVSGAAPTAAGTLPDGTTSVTMAEPPDDAWRATLAGSSLQPVAGSWQSFAVPPGASGEIGISIDPMGRWLSLLIPAVAAFVLVAAAMRPGKAER